MTQDPIQALENFYTSHTPPQTSDEMLGQIFKARGKKKQKIYGAVYGFTFGATIAVVLLVWAARPSHSSNSDTLSTIARLQMINSGLVSRQGRSTEVIR
jgi:hypothetical protein